MALILALQAGAARAGTFELRPGGTLVLGGTTNTFLQPDPARAEPLGLLSPRLALAWWGTRLRLGAAYVFSAQHYAASGLTGLSHELAGAVEWHAARDLLLEARLGGSFSDYDAAGPTGESATVPVQATSSGAALGGLGFDWRPGAVGLRGAWVVTGRRSTAVLSTDVAEPVDELVHEAILQLLWRLDARSRIAVGPAGEVRLASTPLLTYRGLGGLAEAWLRTWRGGELELALRVQHNVFAGRSDLFTRASVGLGQRFSPWARVSLRYAYSANGSLEAAYDADRHLLLVLLDLQAPAARWGRR